MSFCPNCGAEIKGDASFCSRCGTPLASAVAAPASNASTAPASVAQPEPTTQSETAAQPAPQSQPQAAAQPQSAPTTQSETAAQPAPQPQPQPQPQPEPIPQPQPAQTYSAPQQPQQPQQPVYAQGCVSAAWSDITKTKGWFGKVALMALINFIPILNWIIPGYCMRWSRQLVFGRVEDMPKNIFCNRAFVNGVFAFVLGLVIGIVLWICDMILGFIPIIGWIAIIVLSFFAVMFEYLCYMRAAVADSLGAGFQLSKIWEAFTRNLGSLFCATIVPGLIIGIITGIVVTIVISIGIAIVVGGNIFDLIDLIDYYSSFSSSRAGIYVAQTIIQLILSMIPVIIIASYIGGIGTSLTQLLTFRAMGHWVSRYASDWATDPMVTVTAHVYDILEPQQPSAQPTPAPAPNASDRPSEQPPAQQQ